MLALRLKPVLALVLSLVVALTPRVADAATLRDQNFRIARGKHESGSILSGPRLLCLSARTDRTLRFEALFEGSCAYRNLDPVNQFDWNKLMGITTARIHHNSIRLGWRYVPNESKMELGFYGYIQGTRIDRPIAKVNLNEWARVEIRMHRNGLAVSVNGIRTEENRSLGLSSFFPTATWVLCTAYFGGDETAPQDMGIRVRNITAQ